MGNANGYYVSALCGLQMIRQFILCCVVQIDLGFIVKATNAAGTTSA